MNAAGAGNATGVTAAAETDARVFGNEVCAPLLLGVELPLVISVFAPGFMAPTLAICAGACTATWFEVDAAVVPLPLGAAYTAGDAFASTDGDEFDDPPVGDIGASGFRAIRVGEGIVEIFWGIAAEEFVVLPVVCDIKVGLSAARTGMDWPLTNCHLQLAVPAELAEGMATTFPATLIVPAPFTVV